MTLKKANARCSLLLTAALLLHLGLSDFSLLTGWYQAKLSLIPARAVATIAILHIVFSLIILIFYTDGKRAAGYFKLNVRLHLQRVSGLLILLLLFAHTAAFGYFMESTLPSPGITALLAILVLLFYAAVCTHLSVSFSHAFLSLGLLRSEAAEKRMSRIAAGFSLFLFLLSAFALLHCIFSLNGIVG